MAPGLLSVGMGPTVHDVRSAPVPGLSGVAPRPVPGAVRFEDLLRGLAPARPGRPPATPPVQRRLPLAPGAPHAASPPAGSRPALVAAIRHAAGTAGVDSALSLAVARAESNLDPQARSTDGLSVGTFQVTHATAAEMRRKIAAGTVSRPAGPRTSRSASATCATWTTSSAAGARSRRVSRRSRCGTAASGVSSRPPPTTRARVAWRARRRGQPSRAEIRRVSPTCDASCPGRRRGTSTAWSRMRVRRRPRRRWASGYTVLSREFADLIRAFPSGRGEVRRLIVALEKRVAFASSTGPVRASRFVNAFGYAFAARCPGRAGHRPPPLGLRVSQIHPNGRKLLELKEIAGSPVGVPKPDDLDARR